MAGVFASGPFAGRGGYNAKGTAELHVDAKGVKQLRFSAEGYAMSSRRPRRWSQLALIGALLLASAAARANPWTRDQGSFYANLSFSRIAAESFYSPSQEKQPIRPYRQISLGFYAEVGVLDRWLTLTLDGTLYRRASIEEQGRTEGIGDLRIGWWSGLLTAPLRLSAGVLVGIPTGDADPSPDAGTAPGAELIATSLPTGDGEVDVEFKLSLGRGFGGGVWPLMHYAIAEVGYWLRTSGFADAFTYKAELGVQAPYPVIDRLWIIVRFFGVESFASQEEAASSFSGLGDGVTHNSWGIEAYLRIWGGLGVSAGLRRRLPRAKPARRRADQVHAQLPALRRTGDHRGGLLAVGQIGVS